ncbi:MFS transporter [Nocardia terpenica]|uniref:MFS transporter n=1 Tax=Nocardia terpenica TaxID=455432 RepID=UPI0018958571|nr:MFS transporter [Nocardia terpenica]MBF6064791.1 MFS transporter [Nocardia terpenica]MBF6107306.1 MFS transporter [Nocardia terpenica]MBF6115063.1 MFS transporter [Nocardia terpenica]MBF6122169.1 MFS transporter [Nocardia terpenica]MBF6154552.1 MFS transporter [Nocardia terpenica]
MPKSVAPRPDSGRSVLLLLAAGLFAIGTDGYVIAGLLSPIGADLGVGTAAAGRLVTVFALAYALGAPVAGTLTARFSRRGVLLVGLAGFAAANLATTIVGDYGAMLAARVVAALAAAAFTPAASAAAATLVTPERRGRALATVGAGISVATAVGVPLGTLVGEWLGWRATFAGVTALATITALGLAALLPPIPSDAERTTEGFTAIADMRVWAALLLTVTWIMGVFTVLTFIGPILAAAAGVHETALSAWLLIFGIAAVVGNNLGGRAADHYPTGRLLPISTAGLAVALVILALLSSTGGHGRLGAVSAAAAMIGWGIFGWSFAPIQQHRLVDLAPSSAGIVLSFNASAIYIGISGGSLAGSFALERLGAAGVAWTGGLIELIAVAIAISSTSRYNRSSAAVR